MLSCCPPLRRARALQMQLLCLARAVLRDASILILDEANASVDSTTDEIMEVRGWCPVGCRRAGPGGPRAGRAPRRAPKRRDLAAAPPPPIALH